jgi:pimeloyl-ACP methyl ester carboxylesterase
MNRLNAATAPSVRARSPRATGPGHAPDILDMVWRDGRVAAATGLGIAALSGLLVAFAMPRGPVTTAQTLALLAIGFGTGVAAGLAMRSRWAMLLAPVVQLATFELGRLGADGPTVDGLHFDTATGIMASFVGRIFYVLVGLLPMVLGAAYGAGLARRLAGGAARPRTPWRRFGYFLRRGTAIIATAGLVALIVLAAWPAGVPPVLGPDGNALPGSIAELAKVRLGGHDQWVEIRAASPDKPVLLYLSGGPGQSDLPFSRVFFADLARDFVVVGWDQRGTGKSYPVLDPESLTLDRAVADAIELTDYLRARFDEPKIYLLGESWGTILGVLAAQQRPDLYHAFIGSGQMVSVRETDRRLYHDVIDHAVQTGDDDLADQMRGYGEPPYDSIYGNAFVFQHYDKLYKPYDPPQSYVQRGESSGIGPWGLLGSEYTLVERVNALRGLADMFAVMYPQIQGVDFRRDVPRLEVPVYILDGQAELRARRDLALEWYDQLQAPQKRLYSFEAAGHAVAFEQCEAFQRIMTDTILPETYAGR